MTEFYVVAMVASLSFDALLTKLFLATLPVTVFVLIGNWVLERFGYSVWSSVFWVLQGYAVAWLLFPPRTGLLAVDAIGFGVLLISAGVIFSLWRRSDGSKDLF